MSRVRLLADPARHPAAVRLVGWLQGLLDGEGGAASEHVGWVAKVWARVRPKPGVWVDIGWPPRGAALAVPLGPPPSAAPSHTGALVALTDEAADALLPAAAGRPLVSLPYPVPAVFYAPGDARWVHRATQALHLHERPRLVYLGPYDDGRALTRALAVARTVLKSGGELILPNALPWRDGLAPAAARLGLAERIIFTPPLDDSLWAGILLGADLALAPASPDHTWPFDWLGVLAAGLPLVAVDDPLTRQVAGSAALLVDPRRDDVWPDAVRTALYREPVRRELVARASARAAAYHEEPARKLWREAAFRWAAPFSA